MWGIPANGSRVAVHDIFNPLPDFMLSADFLFIDPPWNRGNVRSFYTKAFLDPMQIESFEQFEDVLFGRVLEIRPAILYLEIGNQNVDRWYKWLKHHYPHCQRWSVVYYKKHPTNIIRGSKFSPIDFDYSGMDEAEVIYKSAEIESYNVMGDLCMGQGIVGLAAYAAGKAFVGTELNKRRLANLLKKLAKHGAQIERYS